MTGFYQRFQVLPGPKMWVYFKYVLGPITVVTFVDILYYRGYPNSIGAQPSDVVEVLLYAFKCSTAVIL